MKDDELIKMLFIGVISLAGVGVIFLSRWFDIPISVMVSAVLIELFALVVAVIAIVLRVKEDISLQWFSPLFVAIVYSGFTPLMNYKSVPLHSEALKFTPEFYGQSWFHITVVMAVLSIGYGLIFYKQKNSW